MPRYFITLPGGRIKPFSNSFNGTNLVIEDWGPTVAEKQQRVIDREIPIELDSCIGQTETVTHRLTGASCGLDFDWDEIRNADPNHLFIVIDDEDWLWDRTMRELSLDEEIEVPDSTMYGQALCESGDCDECPHGHGYLDHGFCHDCGYDRSVPQDMAECGVIVQREISRLHALAR